MARTKTRKYKKVSCHTTKAAAKKKAASMRRSGKTATVKGKCVYSAGARRKRRRKKR